MEPLVSIIMGTYNCKDTVENAIASMRNQTYRNWEFIICDDASNDDTRKILEKCAKEDSRIRLLQNEKNCRLAATLNRCLKQCGGKYVARMDADDESLPDRLQKQVDFLEQNADYDVVGCGRVFFDENGDYKEQLLTKEPTARMLLTNPPFVHPTILMRKSVYDELLGYSVSERTMRAEDLDLWFRFYANGHKGYNLPEVLYRYHESLGDYKKRTLRAGWNTSKVYWHGYKLLGFPLYQYVYGLKPLISAALPRKFMYWFHRKRH